MKELQKTIMERGRILYKRITGYFRGNHGDFQMSGRHAGYSREPAVSAGAVEISEFETAGIAGEIKYREQEALSRKSESDHTESEISCTEQTIAGIMQRLKEKARAHDVRWTSVLRGPEWNGDRDERIRKLMERRQSFEAVGGLTGGEQQYRMLLKQKEIQIQTHLSDVQKLKSQICKCSYRKSCERKPLHLAYGHG